MAAITDAIHRDVDGHRAGATGERGHPLALALWSVLRDRADVDKRLVLIALDRRLKSSGMTEKQEQAHYALSLFIDAEGGFPSANEWDRWRKAEPSRCSLPSTTFIRNAFGSWDEARAACDLGAARADVLARRLTALGPALSDEELLGVVRLFGAERAGPLRRCDFERWLRSDAAPRSGRVPRSFDVFRRFGRWPDVLAAAGLSHRRPSRSASKKELLGVVHRFATATEGTLRRDDFFAWWQGAPFDERDDLAGVCSSR